MAIRNVGVELLALYSGGPRFISRPGDRLSWLFLYNVHMLERQHYVFWATGSVIKWTVNK
jgi:hypothetical protein